MISIFSVTRGWTVACLQPSAVTSSKYASTKRSAIVGTSSPNSFAALINLSSTSVKLDTYCRKINMNITTIIIIGGIVLIILLIIGVFVSSNSERALVEKRLSQYLDDDKQSSSPEAQRSIISDWVSKRVEKTSYGDRVARSLSRADMKFKVGEYFVLVLACILIGGLLTWFIGNKNLISAGIGAIAGAFGPGMYVKSQQKKRLQRIRPGNPGTVEQAENRDIAR